MMAVKTSCAGEFIYVEGHKLNVTLRNAIGCEMLADGDDSLSVTNPMANVMVATIETWLRVGEALQANEPETILTMDSPEVATDFITTNTDPDNQLTAPMCTVWGKFKGVSITVVSSELPIDAYRTALAWRRAFKVVGASMNPNGQPAQQISPTEQSETVVVHSLQRDKSQRRVGGSPPQDTMVEAGKQDAPVSSAGLPDGVVWANQRLNYDDYNELQYENGQGVAYNVSNIELTETKNGKACVKLATLQGKHTVFCRDFKDEKRSPDFARLVDGEGAFIAAKYEEYKAHGDKFARDGNWVVIMKIAHVAKNDGTSTKEYKNVASLYAVEAQAVVHPF